MGKAIQGFLDRWRAADAREKFKISLALLASVPLFGGLAAAIILTFGFLDVLGPFYVWMRLDIGIKDYIWIRGIISFLCCFLAYLYCILRFEARESEYPEGIFYQVIALIFYSLIAGWSWVFFEKQQWVLLIIGPLAASKFLDFFKAAGNPKVQSKGAKPDFDSWLFQHTTRVTQLVNI